MPASTSTSNPPADPSLSLPRLLCLHGGGVNAAIFAAQSRSLIKHLSRSFRLVWADGPFLCPPHSDVIAVYGTYAPFRRWLRWLPEHPDIDADSAIEEITYALRLAMEDDDRAGGRGEWVGLMGFSQGAKLAGSMLLEQQAREVHAAATGEGVGVGTCGVEGVRWRFGVLLAGRAPLARLNEEIQHSKALVGAEAISEGFGFVDEVDEEAVLRTPTVHVHGMADPGLHLHRRLLEQYCEEGSTTLVEWDGAHRIPIKGKDVERVVNAIYDVAEKTGVPVTRSV